MAKLIVEVDLTFNTDALLVDEDFSEVHLDYDAGRSKFESTDYQELEFELISTHPEAEAAFLFKPKDGDKASVFKVQYNSNAPGLFVELKGTFSVNLRSGVDQLLKEYQDSLDLRLRAVTWKGGAYMGFAAIVTGGDYEQQSDNWRETFPAITNYSIRQRKQTYLGGIGAWIKSILAADNNCSFTVKYIVIGYEQKCYQSIGVSQLVKLLSCSHAKLRCLHIDHFSRAHQLRITA